MGDVLDYYDEPLVTLRHDEGTATRRQIISKHCPLCGELIGAFSVYELDKVVFCQDCMDGLRNLLGIDCENGSSND